METEISNWNDITKMNEKPANPRETGGKSLFQTSHPDPDFNAQLTHQILTLNL